MNKKQVKIRTFKGGATRDLDSDKLDYEGFLSSLSLESFAKYMNAHRKQADGELRDSDNWKKGITLDSYMKSMFRHFMKVWRLHRGYSVEPERVGGVLAPVDIEAALCGVFFNVQGYLHEYLKQKK